MVGEEMWQEVHQRFFVAQQSKLAISLDLGLDRKTVRRLLKLETWRPYERPQAVTLLTPRATSGLTRLGNSSTTIRGSETARGSHAPRVRLAADFSSDPDRSIKDASATSPQFPPEPGARLTLPAEPVDEPATHECARRSIVITRIGRS